MFAMVSQLHGIIIRKSQLWLEV
jgi:hypothetical protein